MPQSRERKRAYMRAYMALRRAGGTNTLSGEGLTQYLVSPYRHPFTLPKPLARWLRGHGVDPESLDWEKLRDVLLGLETPRAGDRRHAAQDARHEWMLERIRSLEQENARLLDVLEQLDRHSVASRRIFSEQQAPYGVKRNRTPQATVPLRNEEAGREA